MTAPVNILQQVKLVTPEMLAYLQNSNCAVGTWNKKYQNFDKQTGSLGSSIAISLPTRAVVSNTLVASFEGIEQKIQNLTVDTAANSAQSITNQEYIFNLSKEDFMREIGMARVQELGSEIEKNILLDFASARPVGDINGAPTGALHTESGPYRFYGNTTDNLINSYQQIRQAVVSFKNTGMAGNIKCYLPITIEPVVVGSGLNQFVPRRNDEIAMSWEIGSYGGVDFYSSNMLPLHEAGTVGNSAQTLTVVSTDDPTGANITQITFSGATNNDANAIKSGDMGQFSLASGVKFLTFYGRSTTSQTLQFRSTTNVQANGSGRVTITLAQPLRSLPGLNQNISTNIVAGMTATVLPSHRCGGLVAGDAAYLSMPKLPDEDPFPTSSVVDKDTGAALRTYYGSLFGQNQRGLVTDAVWAATMVPLYSMRLIFPTTY